MKYTERQLSNYKKKFETAVIEFGKNCFRLQANERAFQGWLSKFVMDQVPFEQVYREIHLPKSGLEWGGFKNAFVEHGINTKGNELFPDVSVSWGGRVDARHARARFSGELGDATRDLIRKFAIVSELKVTGSTSNRTSAKQVSADLMKLHSFACTHHMQGRKRVGPFATYMIVVDNHAEAKSSKELATIAIETSKGDGKYSGWEKEPRFARPTLMLISGNSRNVEVTAFRDGSVEPEVLSP